MLRQLHLRGLAQPVTIKCQPLVTGKKVKVPTEGSKLVFKCVDGPNENIQNDLTVALSGLEVKKAG